MRRLVGLGLLASVVACGSEPPDSRRPASRAPIERPPASDDPIIAVPAASLQPPPGREASLVIDGEVFSCDDAQDFCACANPILRRHRRARLVQMRGDWETRVGLNLTRFRANTVFDLRGFRLTGRGCPAVVDRSNSTGLETWGGRIQGSAQDPPAIGILDSRIVPGHRASGSHSSFGVTVVGHYRVAAYVNIGSESSTWVRPRFENRRGTSAMWLRRNTVGATSEFGVEPENEASSTSGTIVGLRTRTDAGHEEPTVLIQGFDRLTFTGHTQLYGEDGVPLLVDGAANAVVGLTIDDAWAIGGGEGGVHFVGSARSGVLDVRIRATKIGGSVRCAFAANETVLHNVQLSHHQPDLPFCLEDVVWLGNNWLQDRLRRRHIHRPTERATSLGLPRPAGQMPSTSRK